MAFTSKISRDRSRRRRQFMSRAFMWMLGLGALGGLGYSAYQTGTMLAESRVVELERSLVVLTGQLETTNQEKARVLAGLAEMRQANAALQARYDADVPKGELAELFGIVRGRLAQNVPAARLSQVMQDAGVTRPCETRVTRKRFAIVPAGRTPEEVSLLDGLVQVSASAPAVATDGLKGVSVLVARAWTGEPLKLAGLPVRQDIVVNNLVLRLAVEPSDVAGYAVATLSGCGKV
jgi:hypothetical protein